MRFADMLRDIKSDKKEFTVPMRLLYEAAAAKGHHLRSVQPELPSAGTGGAWHIGLFDGGEKVSSLGRIYGYELGYYSAALADKRASKIGL
jgi:hypothetical protein